MRVWEREGNTDGFGVSRTCEGLRMQSWTERRKIRRNKNNRSCQIQGEEMKEKQLRAKIRQLIKEITRTDDFHDNTTFRDIGMDSLDAVDIITGIERYTGADIEWKIADVNMNIDDIIDIVKKEHNILED